MFLLLLLSLVFVHVDITQAAIPIEERDALIALYNGTGGDGWTDNTGWKTDSDFSPSGSECTWYGISCSGDHVTQINLYSNHLTGSLPAALSDLTSLTALALDNNQLTGTIPTQLDTLKDSLQILKLSHNKLTGGIPAELGSLAELLTLYLYDNTLTGAIPASLGGLAKLKDLSLYSNQLTGEIPGELGQLHNLLFLDLSSNRLQGEIPIDLSNLTNLFSLDICNNYLSATDQNLRDFLDAKSPGWEDCQLPPPAKFLPAVNQLLLSD